MVDGQNTCHTGRGHRNGLPASRRHHSPERLWEALVQGDDLVTEIPPDRWDADEYYDPEPGVPGRSVSKWGAFLDNVAGFDSDFFGISEREATAIDPQHRLLLETSWEAMEHAGLTPETVAESLTGVFVGLTHTDYQLVAVDACALEGPYGFMAPVSAWRRADRLHPGSTTTARIRSPSASASANRLSNTTTQP